MKPLFLRSLLTLPLTRPALRPTGNYLLRAIGGVIIHWTANTTKGSNALANRNYFQNGCPGPSGTKRAASAHYIVDSKQVVQCLPETEVGFHVGDKPLGKYKPAGLNLMTGYKGLTPNYFTLGIEMCVNADGNWDFTYENTVNLTAELLIKHGLKVETGLLRHFDVTGKKCPQPMIDEHAWNAFRLAVALRVELLEKICQGIEQVTTTEVNVRSGPGVKHGILHTLLPGERVFVYEEKDGWHMIGSGRWMNALYTKPVKLPV